MACRWVFLLALCAALLACTYAQDTVISFEVFKSPPADCITNTPPIRVSFADGFPAGTRPPPLFYSYAGSMPGEAGQVACRQVAAATGTKPPVGVVLHPSFEGESQGLLKVLAVAGDCSSPTSRAPVQFAVQVAGDTELGLVSCPNKQVCHLYYASTTRKVVKKSAAGCVYCGSICRVVVKKGILLNTVSDDNKGPCCDGCNCKFSHYVQVGRLFNRVRTLYYYCKDPTCFPASSTVEVAGRGKQPLSSLRVGDAVLAVDSKTGKRHFSEVYALPHRVLNSRTAYLELTDAHNRTLTLSAGHLVYTSSLPSHRLADYTALPASALRPGHYVWSQAPAHASFPAAPAGSGTALFGPARVEKIDRVHGAGMIAPFTVQGTLVVDGVLASSYATHGALSADVAHAALAPLRWAWRVCPAALRALHRGGQGDSPALLAAGLRVLDAAERAQGLLASSV